jgi:hypothetical protein
MGMNLERLLDQEIVSSKQELIEDGDLLPHILVLNRRHIFYVPAMVTKDLRPHDWISIVAKTLKPEGLIFTSIVRMGKASKDYTYGDLQKSKRRAVLVFLVDFKTKSYKGVLIPFEIRSKKKVIFKETEDFTPDQGAIPEIVEELFRELNYIQ